MKSKIKNIIYNVILIFLAFFILMQVILPDISMKIFRFRTFLVAPTGSMEPELTHMDFIFVVRGKYEDINVGNRDENIRGDYIVFYDLINGKYHPNTHEVVGMKTIDDHIFYQTQGIKEGLGVDDRWVSLNKVLLNGKETNEYIGKFSFKVPYLGKAISFLRSLPGILFLTINITAIVIAVKIMKKKDLELEQTKKEVHEE